MTRLFELGCEHVQPPPRPPSKHLQHILQVLAPARPGPARRSAPTDVRYITKHGQQ